MPSSLRVTETTEVPRLAFSSAGVPSAMTRPWSTTTMSGQAVGLLEVLGGEQHGGALGHQVLDDAPQVLAALGVEPGRRLVQEEDRRAGDQGGGQVEPATHAARVRLEGAVGGVGEAEVARAARRPVGPTSFQLMWLSRPTMRMFSRPVRFSSTAAYWPASPMIRRTVSASLTTSWPRMVAWPESGFKMVDEDADGGGLAGAVGAEQPKDGARFDLERHPVEARARCPWGTP